MNESTESPSRDLFGSHNLEMLLELEQNQAEAIQHQRTHERVRIRAQVTLRPGSRSHRDLEVHVGMTGDISGGGLLGLFETAPRVGDLYRVEFDRTRIDTPPMLVICKRCRMVRDDAFEAGLAFFHSIDLSEALKSDAAE